MSNKQQITKLINVISGIEDCIRKGYKDIEIAGANREKELALERIFKRSFAADDATFFGTYRSKSYIKKRERAGRQTKVKDLQFTDEFRKDLDIGEFNGKTAVGFAQDRSANIVTWQEAEKQIGAEIFSASAEEIDIVTDTIVEEFNKLIDECLKRN